MIFRTGLKRKHEWHKWFAWHPVVVDVDGYGRYIFAWLETVERSFDESRTYTGDSAWSYRRLKEKTCPN